MPNTRIVTAGGAIDGVNVKFYTPVPYVPGSTTYILNGRTRRADLDDGYTESSPGTGEITVSEAPLPGDVVQIFFTDTAPSVSSPIEKLSAAVSVKTQLTGTLKIVEPTKIIGILRCSCS